GAVGRVAHAAHQLGGGSDHALRQQATVGGHGFAGHSGHSLPRSGNLDPGAADLAQQVAHFIEQLAAVLEVGAHQLATAVFVEVGKVRGDLSASLKVQAGAQLFDYRHRTVDEAVLRLAF